MTQEIYQLAIAYIKAYYKYKKIYYELMEVAGSLRAVQYDKEKVQVSTTCDTNYKIIEAIELESKINKTFSCMKQALHSAGVSKQIERSILMNIYYENSMTHSFFSIDEIEIAGTKEFFLIRERLIREVAKELVGIGLEKIEAKYMEEK